MPQRVGVPTTPAVPRPAAPAPRRPATPPDATATPRGWTPQARPARPAPVFPPASSYPTTSDGTPIFKQADPSWGGVMLGRERTIAQAGCAMTSVAMAISKVSGQPLTPRELDAYLDKRKGYSGDALDWDKAGAARNLKVNRERWSLGALDAQLDAGKPVVVGVDYKQGSNGGPNGTDHWICVTRKGVDEHQKPFYWANDPGTGKEIKLYPDAKGRLAGAGADALGKYRTTNQMMSFDPKD